MLNSVLGQMLICSSGYIRQNKEVHIRALMLWDAPHPH